MTLRTFPLLAGVPALSLRAQNPPLTHRRVTLMQDRLYRDDVTHRSMGYPHVPMISFYLGVAK